LILAMTRLASSRLYTIGVEFGLLVQRNGVDGVGRAKYVAAVTAVMFADKEIERRATLG